MQIRFSELIISHFTKDINSFGTAIPRFVFQTVTDILIR